MLGRFAFSPLFSVSNFPQRNETKTIQKTEKATAISELEQAKIDQFSSCILCVHKTHTRPVRRTIMIECFLPREEQNRGRRFSKLVRAPQSKDLIIVNHAEPSRARRKLS